MADLASSHGGSADEFHFLSRGDPRYFSLVERTALRPCRSRRRDRAQPTRLARAKAIGRHAVGGTVGRATTTPACSASSARIRSGCGDRPESLHLRAQQSHHLDRPVRIGRCCRGGCCDTRLLAGSTQNPWTGGWLGLVRRDQNVKRLPMAVWPYGPLDYATSGNCDSARSIHRRVRRPHERILLGTSRAPSAAGPEREASRPRKVVADSRRLHFRCMG